MQHYSGFGLIKHGFNHHENWQRIWRNPTLKSYYNLITVGSGHDLATAYYLTKEFGTTNVADIENGYLQSSNKGGGAIYIYKLLKITSKSERIRHATNP